MILTRNKKYSSVIWILGINSLCHCQILIWTLIMNFPYNKMARLYYIFLHIGPGSKYPDSQRRRCLAFTIMNMNAMQ